MKKFSQLKVLVIGILLGIGLTATTTVVANNAVNAVFKNVNYIVNGQKISTDSPALVVSNSNYLKLRDIATMLEHDVSWESKTNTVTFTRMKTTQENKALSSEESKATSKEGETPTYTAIPATIINEHGTTTISTTVPIVKSTSKADADDEQRTKEINAPISKLPISISKGDFTMTLQPFEKDEKGNTILVIDTVNNSGKFTKIYNDGNSWYTGIDNKWTPIGLNVDFGQSFDDVEKTHRINLGKGYALGATKLRLYLSMSGGYKYVFNINTDGIL